MNKEELEQIKKEIMLMPLEPPWCENVYQLKKWIEGYESCKESILLLLDSKGEK